jgi:DNA-binding transcriptional ArsR family regulator
MEMEEKLEFIQRHDPESVERLKRLLERKSYLMEGNVYGEQFTERQFNLVFTPLLASSYERAKVLDALSGGEKTVLQAAEELSLDRARVFDHLKELMRRNLVEIVRFEERNPVFRKR